MPTGAAKQRICTRGLLAEDNVMNQQVAARMLEKLGCQVDVAPTGRDAVEMASRFSYDLIFMDCLMPEMDGLEATREIRRLEGGRRRVPIIAMTALAMEGDSKRCIEAGMDDYLSKPVTLEELEAALCRWSRPLAGRAGAEPAQESAAPKAPAAGSTSAPLDATVVARLRSLDPGNDGSLVDGLLNAFVDNAMATIELLRQAACAGDPRVLTQAAHSLRSSSRNVGALALAEICERLEAAGKGGCAAGAGACIDELEQEFGRVKGSLRT